MRSHLTSQVYSHVPMYFEREKYIYILFSPNLKFTIEHEQEGLLAFLDLCITHSGNTLQSSRYTKSTDTGLTMNFHAVAPRKYKRSVVQGFAHRIFRACSGWKQFDESLDKAKQTLERNQYPPEFYDPIIATTIEKLVSQNPAAANEGATPQLQPNPTTPSPDGNKNQSTECETKQIKTVNLSLQYRGRATDNLLRKMKQMNSQIKPVLTLRKLKTALPSLKPPVPKKIRSRVVYQIECPGCNASYVGQTVRHLNTRYAEHRNVNSIVGSHFMECIGSKPDFGDVTILCATTRGAEFLMTLEALYINEIRPEINTKDEYRSRTLTLKF